MIRTIGIVFAAAALAACRGNGALNRRSQQYNVVQEGSASGVTSTINGPGETPPPVNPTPITGTDAAADTTTNFTLPTPQAGKAQQPGNLAGTLPPPDASGRMGVAPPPRRTPQIQPRVTPEPSEPPAYSPRTRPTPPPTETSTAPPATDPSTAAPATTTAAPPTSTDSTQPLQPPPPPTTTAMRGDRGRVLSAVPPKYPREWGRRARSAASSRATRKDQAACLRT